MICSWFTPFTPGHLANPIGVMMRKMLLHHPACFSICVSNL
jgi:hypothetical protein